MEKLSFRNPGHREKLQQKAASSQLADLIETMVKQEEPWRLVLAFRARAWPGGVLN